MPLLIDVVCTKWNQIGKNYIPRHVEKNRAKKKYHGKKNISAQVQQKKAQNQNRSKISSANLVSLSLSCVTS